MRDLIHKILAPRYGSTELHKLQDGALLGAHAREIIFTTDSYVVQPLHFPGGDIGTLAVSGTVNDLLVMGAEPRWLSVGMIIEEGLQMAVLEMIVDSIARTAALAGVEIVTGDTKVVPRGRCDGLYINTSGIGLAPFHHGLSSESVAIGDAVIISGTLGDHAVAILGSRMDMKYSHDGKSDCAPLTAMVSAVLRQHRDVKWMRDPTRGGLAACLDEFATSKNCAVLVQEQQLPVAPSTHALCELLGFDPLHLANEGKIMFLVASRSADAVLATLRTTEHGANAAVIGTITSLAKAGVTIETLTGASRRLSRPTGELLPRIC